MVGQTCAFYMLGDYETRHLAVKLLAGRYKRYLHIVLQDAVLIFPEHNCYDDRRHSVEKS